jgi:single stranded DNA-binding protein
MEHLNKVQLRGVVGTVNLQELSGKRVCRFTLATDRAYKDAMGEAKIDTTWHTVNAWEGSKNIPDLELIKKGSKVEVLGRIRNNKVENVDGITQTYSDIQAVKVKLYNDDEQLSIEM